MSLLVLAGQIFLLMIVIAVGFVSGRLGILDEHTAERMTDFLMKVSIPCLLISSVGTEPLTDGSEALWQCGAIFALYYLIGIFGVWFLLGRKKISREHRAVLTCMAVIPNTAFIGFPLVASLLGQQATPYVGMMLIAFNVVFFTVGMALLTGEKKVRLKTFLTPCNFATVVMLILFVTNTQLNDYMYKLLTQFASITTPIALLVIGVNLAKANVLLILKKKMLYLLSGIRLFVMPALLMLAVHFGGVPPMMKMSLLIGSACPGSALAAVIVSKEKEERRLSSEAVVHSTLFSAVTIPIWIYFFV